MHYEVSVVAKVPRAKAYSAYTDFESGPKWSVEKTPVKVSRREGNKVYMEQHPGKGDRGVREMRLFPPERVESGSETRFTRTKNVIRFEEVPQGTKVTASLDLEVKGHWSWIMRTKGREGVESSALEMLNSFAKYVEGLR